MDDFTWHARGQLCEQYATAKNGQRHIYRVGVFERKEYATRAAECVTACIGIPGEELRTNGVVPLTRLLAAGKERQALIDANKRLADALDIAESFMSGFEGDELQEGIDEKLAQIRAARAGATS